VLQRGATRVVAIDVGRNQLHEKIRADDRVDVHEQTNVRHTDPADFGGPGDLVVTDLSFISLRVVAPHLVAFAADGADLVILVKPQFEAGKAEADKARGVIAIPRCGVARSTTQRPRSRPPERPSWGSWFRRSPEATATSSSSSMPVLVHPMSTRCRGNSGAMRPLRQGRGADGVVGMIVHLGRASASAQARELADGLIADGHAVRAPHEDAETAGLDGVEIRDGADFADGLDLVVALGGDGSMLRAIELVGSGGTPIMGVDHGSSAI
jgi:hypothetical protein